MIKKKKIVKKLSTDDQNYTGALLENMDSKIDFLVDGHQFLNQKIDDFKKDVDERFNEVDYKFEAVFEKFDEVADELRIIRNDLKEKVGRDEFIVLEKRIIVLERAKTKI